MTKVNNYQEQVNPAEFTQALQNYNQDNSQVTYGMEMEKLLLTETGELPCANIHDKFYTSLAKALKDKVSVEPGAHMIEIKTGVNNNAKELESELNSHLETLKAKAKKHRLKLLKQSGISHLPLKSLKENFVSLKDPLTNQTRRAPSIMGAYTKLGFGEIVDYAMNSSSVHFTHSTQNMEQLHRWAKVHSALMPLYYAVFENRERTAEGHQAAYSLRKNMRDRCLVTPYVFEAKDGNELAKKYTQSILDTTLYSKLDVNGEDANLEREETFRTLPKEEQNLANFLQAASFQWGVCKIKPTIDNEALEQGELKFSNLLLEVRDFETSDKSLAAITGWLGNLVKDEEHLSEMEVRLEELGVAVESDPMAAFETIKTSLDKVGSKDTEFLETSIGNKGKTLRDMVSDVVLPMLKKSSADKNTYLEWQGVLKSKTPPFSTVSNLFNKATNNVKLTNQNKLNQLEVAVVF